MTVVRHECCVTYHRKIRSYKTFQIGLEISVRRDSVIAGADINWYLQLGWERGSGGKKFISAGICDPRGYLNDTRNVPTRPGCRQGSAFVSIIRLLYGLHMKIVPRSTTLIPPTTVTELFTASPLPILNS